MSSYSLFLKLSAEDPRTFVTQYRKILQQGKHNCVCKYWFILASFKDLSAGQCVFLGTEVSQCMCHLDMVVNIKLLNLFLDVFALN